jgi:phage protein D
MPSTHNTPVFKILVGGQDLSPEEQNTVHEIKVTDWLRLPDVCTVAVGYESEPEKPYDNLDKSAFKIGATLEVKLGSIEETTTQTLFKGEIVTVEPDFQAGGVDMVVRAYDRSHRMMRSRRQKSYLNQTISDIVTSVGSANGLSVDADSTGGPLDFVLQHNETDWEFVWRLAKRIGYEFLVDDTSAKFQKPKADGEAVELRYPDDLHSFRPRITAVQQVDSVNVRGFDMKQKQKVERQKNTPVQLVEAGITR